MIKQINFMVDGKPASQGAGVHFLQGLYFLKKLTTKIIITAPTVAAINVSNKPFPKLIPIKENTQDPKKDPTIPSIRLIIHPKPVPFTK